MSAWTNTDAPTAKPKMDVERTTREVLQLTVYSTVTSGNVISFSYNDGGQNNVANIGVTTGQYVYAANLSTNGIAGFFASNNYVLSNSGNSVTFNSTNSNSQ